MKNKVIIKNNVDSLHEFDITKRKHKNGNIVYTLSYSKDSHIWTRLVLGKTILKCVNTGDNYKFAFNEKFDFANLEYDETFFMHIVLKYIYKNKKSGKIKFK